MPQIGVGEFLINPSLHCLPLPQNLTLQLKFKCLGNVVIKNYFLKRIIISWDVNFRIFRGGAPQILYVHATIMQSTVTLLIPTYGSVYHVQVVFTVSWGQG